MVPSAVLAVVSSAPAGAGVTDAGAGAAYPADVPDALLHAASANADAATPVASVNVIARHEPRSARMDSRVVDLDNIIPP
jgi:hypothetical protein